MFYQQGDVLLKAVNEIPGDVQDQKTDVLVMGESTGHAHRVTSGDYKIVRNAAVMYLLAYTIVKIQHEEHDIIELPPGTYLVDQVKEYDHFAKEVRTVVD